MKKIYTQLFLCLFVLSNAYSQIPNASFENWTTYNGTNIFMVPYSGVYPTGWQTTDSLSMYANAGHTVVQDGTDKCDMLYSVKIITVSNPLNAPSVATNGTLGVGTVSGGSPDTARSAQLTGCYEYTPVSSDTGIISAYLFRWNGSSRDTIAATRQLLLTMVSTMTNFQYDFFYKDFSHQPDTILVILQSSPAIGSIQPGSTLIVDNLGLTGYVGIHENSLIKNIRIFPQPAQNELDIQVELNQNISLKYEIADITGRKILSDKLKSTNEKIDISILSRGNYFISLRNEEGAVLYSSKFIVSK